jgi:hypothetical protein
MDDLSHNFIQFLCQVCSGIQRYTMNGILFCSKNFLSCKESWASMIRKSGQAKPSLPRTEIKWQVLAAKCGSPNPAVDFSPTVLVPPDATSANTWQKGQGLDGIADVTKLPISWKMQAIGSTVVLYLLEY